MKKPKKILLLQHLKEAGSIIFKCMLLDVGDSYLECFFSEGYLYDIAYLYVIRSFGISAVYLDVVGIARVVCNGAALYDTCHFQIFVKSHAVPFYSDKNRAAENCDSVFHQNYLLTDSLRTLLAEKAGYFAAGIVIFSFVLGFLPALSALCFTSKDPRPDI